MTLSDCLKHYDDPIELPQVGRPQELSKAEEEAIMNCLVLCGEFQYPMNKKDPQNFVQAYVVENTNQTRWPDGRPGKDWVRSFTRRWRHKVKVKKPSNIKRCRAKVSPQMLKKFFANLTPNLEDVVAAHFFNYDESNLNDDPGADDCFFAGNKSKIIARWQNAASNGSVQIRHGGSLSELVRGQSHWHHVRASKNRWFNMSKFNRRFKEARVLFQFLPNNLKT